MSATPPYPQRRALRLSNYDYSQAGAYFITVCTHQRLPILGSIRAGEMSLSAAGRIVAEEWDRTPTLRPNVTLDAYVIMPNHIHGILLLEDRVSKEHGDGNQVARQSFSSPAQSIGAIIRGVKAASTSRIRRLPGHAAARVWQREYYDHVIRDEGDLARIREYIQNNPLKWELDRYYLKVDEMPWG